MPLTLVTPPATEPVALVDVKNNLRVDSDITQDDALIQMLITAARTYAEMACNSSFITQKWRLTMDAFPGGLGAGGGYSGAGFSLPQAAVVFERGPVQSVDSIVYTAMDGSTQTIATPGMPGYAVDLSGQVARMTPAFGQVWPIPMPQIGAVQINYTAGYGNTAAAVPQGICHWIMVRVSSLYRNREEVALLARGAKMQELPYVDSLLDPYRIMSV